MSKSKKDLGVRVCVMCYNFSYLIYVHLQSILNH